ncbi:MAG: thioesterase family protein [Planctomycetia bacterium]|nr:thioesterase family protein [Planctomycetia bacterium]
MTLQRHYLTPRAPVPTRRQSLGRRVAFTVSPRDANLALACLFVPNAMYFTTPLTPQIADTDMQGHVNFLAYSQWFDRARTRLYREIDSDLNFRPHGMVVLKTEVVFLKEVYVQFDVEIRTYVSVIGTKSFEVTQEVWQRGERCALGKSIFCAFNFESHASEPLLENFRVVLQRYHWRDPELA